MLGEVDIGRSARDYARFVCEDADVDGIDIFCCDKTGGRGEVVDIYGYGMGAELKDGYRRWRIYEVDPFTDVAIREAHGQHGDSFELGRDPQVQRTEGRADKYWRFMAEKDVEIIGAATRRLLPGVYLVVGLHRINRARERTEIAPSRLDPQLRTVKDMVSASLLTRLLQTGDGYGQLRRTMGFGQAKAQALPALSPRETEIAQLICTGKQNKEIAYLTGLSVHTIENHLKRIYRKFHIQNRAALVAKLQT